MHASYLILGLLFTFTFASFKLHQCFVLLISNDSLINVFLLVFFKYCALCYVVQNRKKLCVVPIANRATIFTIIIGGSHSETKASTAYWANERHIIAIWDGLSTNVDTQEKRNAGGAPNASMKYAHSAPDDVFIVPSSAYASAPAKMFKLTKKFMRQIFTLSLFWLKHFHIFIGMWFLILNWLLVIVSKIYKINTLARSTYPTTRVIRKQAI